MRRIVPDMTWVTRAAAAGLSALAGVAARDLLQREHTLLRNFPVIGHARYLLESVGPELRQYLVAGNNEERPFTRDQRRWVYASAKKENNYFGFGTDNDLEYTAGYPVINHRTFGRAVPPTHVDAGAGRRRCRRAKVLGAARGRRQAFRPPSVVNISAMSFGSLSGRRSRRSTAGQRWPAACRTPARAACRAHHRHGGELVFQIGTAYFGCRDDRGRFDLARLKDLVAGAPVRALEIKLSQGAKPGLGGVLPGGQGLRRDRRDPGRAAKAWTASAPRGTRSSPTSTACSTGWSCWPPRPGCRSASSPPSATWGSGTSSPS